MLISDRLKSFPFSNSEKRIVDYILLQGIDIKNMTSNQIAQATFSSKSTLTRLSKKLDYTGWSDLKKDFLDEITYLDRFTSDIDANKPFKQNDSLMSIASKLATLEKEAIDDTLSLLNHDNLRKGLDILANSKTIHLFAVSNNLLISQEFVHNMSRIGKDVRIHTLQSELVFKASLAEVDSCAIIISYTGETKVLTDILSILKTKQIKTIAITSVGQNSISRNSDCVLNISTREKLYSKIGTFSTDYSITYLLDVLYSCIFAQDYNKNLELKIKSGALLEKHRSTDSFILKEL